jgi:hypothetical protein
MQFGGSIRTKGVTAVGGNPRHLHPQSGGMFASSTTPSPVSMSGNVSSSSSSVSSSRDPGSKDFPPLGDGRPTTGNGPSQVPKSLNGVWNGSLTGSMRSSDVAGLPPRPGSTESGGRLDDTEKKFDRPPPRNGVALYNPRGSDPNRPKSKDRPGQVTSQGNKARDVDATSTDALAEAVNTLSLSARLEKPDPQPITKRGDSFSTSGSSFAATDAGSADS